MHPLEALLAERDWVLADGAMGTNLFALGLAGGASGERWNLDEPTRVESVHRDMVAAGADIILTNTFGANRYRLALHGLGDRAIEVNESGAAIARRVADETDRPVVVAGSMGPTGDVLEPLGERTLAEAFDAFAEQAEGLRRGGVDVAWIETMYAENELDEGPGRRARRVRQHQRRRDAVRRHRCRRGAGSHAGAARCLGTHAR